MNHAILDSLTDTDLVGWYPRGDRPRVRVNFVSGVDGAGSVDGLSAGLSGEADKRVFRILRMLCDGLLVGAGTLRAEEYRPLRLDAERRAWRRANGLPEFPRLVVVTGSLDLDPALPALAQAPVRPVVLTFAAVPVPRHLDRVAEVVTATDLTAGLTALHERGLRDLLCEGGPTLFGSLAASDLVDELCLTVSPVLAADGGRISAGSAHLARRMAPVHAIVAADGNLLLRYQHRRP